MVRRHPGPVDKGRLLRPTCAKNEGFAIRATLANLSTVTLATLRPVQQVGKCYSVASLTVCECPKIPSTRNTRQLVHCYTRNTTPRPASGRVLQCCEFDSVRVSKNSIFHHYHPHRRGDRQPQAPFVPPSRVQAAYRRAARSPSRQSCRAYPL